MKGKSGEFNQISYQNEYIKEKYGEQYTFEQTLRSDRKGNDVKDYILLFNFQQNTAE
jgi:hypothetical protein